MSVGSDPDGGFWVPPDTNGRIVSRILEFSPMRRHASIVQVSSDQLKGEYDTVEATGGWVGELETRDESTTPTIGEYTIDVQELFAQPAVTQRLLDDAAFNVESWLVDKTGTWFGRLEGTAFTTGNGVKKARGFASYATAATADDTRAWGTMEHVASGAAGSFGTDPAGVNLLISLITAMNPAYLANAAWWMNRTTLGKVRTLADGGGRHVFIPSFQVGMPDSLCGYPVAVAPDMVSYTTSGALGLALADMRAGYAIVEKPGGSRLIRDSITTKGKVKFYTTRRVGGDVVNFDAIKFLKFS